MSTFVEPTIAQLFIGTLLPLKQFSAGVHYRRSVPTDDVLATWQPGMEEYDRIAELPSD